jgi:hypothetical protein
MVTVPWSRINFWSGKETDFIMKHIEQQPRVLAHHHHLASLEIVLFTHEVMALRQDKFTLVPLVGDSDQE